MQTSKQWALASNHSASLSEAPMKFHAIIGTLLLTLTLTSHGGQDTQPETTTIVLPTVPVTVEPTPIPDPQPLKVIDTLTSDKIWVVESATELIVRQYPLGVVSVDPATGPIFVWGKFVDGSGKNEKRQYKSQYIYFITGVKTGTVMLDIIPKGVQEEADIVRQVLTVTGTSPNPPLDIDPEPTPEPQPNPVPTGIRVLLLHNENASLTQLNVINSLEVVTWLEANCAKDSNGKPDYRSWDRTSIERVGVESETEVWKRMWAAVRPQITQDNMIFVAADTKIHVKPITNIQDALLFLQQVKDGK